jgi:hypothetical protein
MRRRPVSPFGERGPPYFCHCSSEWAWAAEHPRRAGRSDHRRRHGVTRFCATRSPAPERKGRCVRRRGVERHRISRRLLPEPGPESAGGRSVSRRSMGERPHDAVIGPHRTTLMRDGKLVFEADGAVVVRRYRPGAFTIKSRSLVHVGAESGDGVCASPGRACRGTGHGSAGRVTRATAIEARGPPTRAARQPRIESQAGPSARVRPGTAKGGLWNRASWPTHRPTGSGNG